MLWHEKRTTSFVAIMLCVTLIGCASKLPPEERARLRAEKERAKMEKAIQKIQPIGKGDYRRMSKEEAYYACNQKAEDAGKSAAQDVKIKQSLQANNSKGGGFAGGALGALAERLEQVDAENIAQRRTMNSCLIDYGYIMKE